MAVLSATLQSESPPAYLVAGLVVAMLLVLFIFVGIYASRYVKVGPNEVLVVGKSV